MIKVKEGMKLSDIVKGVEDGKPWAWSKWLGDGEWDRGVGMVDFISRLQRYGPACVAIIDESQPSIDWNGFKCEFFDPYGGIESITTEDVYGVLGLAPSPLYPWTGGECPVPGNVEVTARILNDGETEWMTFRAGQPDRGVWTHSALCWWVLDFKITGKVL